MQIKTPLKLFDSLNKFIIKIIDTFLQNKKKKNLFRYEFLFFIFTP
jgi:hypothetical protein